MTSRTAVTQQTPRCRIRGNLPASLASLYPRLISAESSDSQTYRIASGVAVWYYINVVKLNEKFVTDKSGRRTEVILSRGDYQKLLDYLEDLEDRLEIRRRKKNASFVPWETVKPPLKRNGKR